MPDATPDFRNDPARLERTLMSLRLHEVLAQLARSAGRPWPAGEGQAETAGNVRAVLGEWLPHVLERGLAPLPAAVLERLLTEPALLLELQELLLCEGGSYWEEVSRRLPEVSTLEPPCGLESLEGPAQFPSRRPDETPCPHRGRPAEQRISGKPVPRTSRSVWVVAAVASTVAGVALAACIVVLVLYGNAESQVARLQHQNRQIQLTSSKAHTEALGNIMTRMKADRKREVQEAATNRLLGLCRGLSALSALPPPEAVAALPPDEAPPRTGSRRLPAAEDETLAFPKEERQLEAEGPRQRALAILLDGLRNDTDAQNELLQNPDKLLRHDDPAVRHGAALALEELGRKRPLSEF